MKNFFKFVRLLLIIISVIFTFTIAKQVNSQSVITNLPGEILNYKISAEKHCNASLLLK